MKSGLSMGRLCSRGRCGWDTLSRAGRGRTLAPRPPAERSSPGGTTSPGADPALPAQPPAFRPPSSFAPEPPGRGGPAARQDGAALSCRSPRHEAICRNQNRAALPFLGRPAGGMPAGHCPRGAGGGSPSVRLSTDRPLRVATGVTCLL